VANSLPVVVAEDPDVDITDSIRFVSQSESESDSVGEPKRGERGDGLPPAVRQHMDRLVSRFSREQVLHRRMLAFLIEHAPGAYTADQIAAWTNCPQELIDEDPPQGLLGAGLIKRERRSTGTLYQSALRAYVNKEFKVFQPDIGETGLHHVTRALRRQLSSIA
jgi:hypothetical protein